MCTALAKNKMKIALIIFAALSLVSCRQIVDGMIPKRIMPEVVQQASKPGNWYAYMPERSPGFCLRTDTDLEWKDSRLQLGYWQGLHPHAPHRVLMEARGDVLIIRRNYVWDGCTVGDTYLRDLLPTLRHDALYHALKEGAQFSRRQVDLAFLRDQRQSQVGMAWFNYLCVRLFGGLYNRPHEQKTMLVRPIKNEKTP